MNTSHRVPDDASIITLSLGGVEVKINGACKSCGRECFMPAAPGQPCMTCTYKNPWIKCSACESFYFRGLAGSFFTPEGRMFCSKECAASHTVHVCISFHGGYMATLENNANMQEVRLTDTIASYVRVFSTQLFWSTLMQGANFSGLLFDMYPCTIRLVPDVTYIEMIHQLSATANTALPLTRYFPAFWNKTLTVGEFCNVETLRIQQVVDMTMYQYEMQWTVAHALQPIIDATGVPYGADLNVCIVPKAEFVPRVEAQEEQQATRKKKRPSSVALESDSALKKAPLAVFPLTNFNFSASSESMSFNIFGKPHCLAALARALNTPVIDSTHIRVSNLVLSQPLHFLSIVTSIAFDKTHTLAQKYDHVRYYTEYFMTKERPELDLREAEPKWWNGCERVEVKSVEEFVTSFA
jgi:hypothetical protein